MLKGISPLLSPDLLDALYGMGHGDEIVLADAHFPAESTGPRCKRRGTKTRLTRESLPSCSGKTLTVAGRNGNNSTDARVNGQPVIVGVNAYIKPQTGAMRPFSEAPQCAGLRGEGPFFNDASSKLRGP